MQVLECDVQKTAIVVLATSITAASLALADAGIEMYTLAVGASLVS